MMLLTQKYSYVHPIVSPLGLGIISQLSKYSSIFVLWGKTYRIFKKVPLPNIEMKSPNSQLNFSEMSRIHQNLVANFFHRVPQTGQTAGRERCSTKKRLAEEGTNHKFRKTKYHLLSMPCEA